MPFAATWMYLEIIILNESSQKKKDKYHMISHVCGTENTAKISICTQQIHTQRQQNTDLWLPRGREGQVGSTFTKFSGFPALPTLRNPREGGVKKSTHLVQSRAYQYLLTGRASGLNQSSLKKKKKITHYEFSCSQEG